jgi:protein JSN1
MINKPTHLPTEFRPPTTYYSSIPVSAERSHNRRWDASKLRELRKRLDSGACTTEEIDEVAADFVDGEIVDLASDWLGNTVNFSDVSCLVPAI